MCLVCAPCPATPTEHSDTPHTSLSHCTCVLSRGSPTPPCERLRRRGMRYVARLGEVDCNEQQLHTFYSMRPAISDTIHFARTAHRDAAASWQLLHMDRAIVSAYPAAAATSSMAVSPAAVSAGRAASSLPALLVQQHLPTPRATSALSRARQERHGARVAGAKERQERTGRRLKGACLHTVGA